MILKAYKYRIFPTDAQKEHLSKCFGCIRLVYNLALETKQNAYKSNGTKLSTFDLHKQLTELKAEYKFLFDCPNMCLQTSIKNMDTAFQNFFKNKAQYPKFKNKRTAQSIQFPQSVELDKQSKQIKFPLIGKIDIELHRNFEGKIKTVTVSKTPTGKYFASILVQNDIELPVKTDIINSVGIDLGLKFFAVTSDGQVFENQKHLSQNLKRLRIEQRSLQRKFKKGAKEQSNNYVKQRLVVAKLHEKITNMRNDFLHKVSDELVKNYDAVFMEDLNIKGMMQNDKLSRSIGEQGWYKFAEMVKYKCEFYGKHFYQINRFAPSSKTCCNCNTKNKDLKLSNRVWECSECGFVNERDLTAAINIREFGLKEIRKAA